MVSRVFSPGLAWAEDDRSARPLPPIKISTTHPRGESETTIRGLMSNDSLVVNVKTNGGFGIITGRAAAQQLAQAALRTAPKAARRIELRDPRSQEITGALWEFLPGSRVFVTARHVLQGVSRESVDRAFKAFVEPLESSQYTFIGFDEFDAVVAVPSLDEKTYFKEGRKKGSGSFLPGKGIQEKLEARSQSFIDAIGTVGAAGGAQAEAIVGSGWRPVAGVDSRYVYLSLLGQEISPGASGALVYLTPVENVQELQPSDWHPGGIVECETPEGLTKRKVKIPSLLRVIPFKTLSKAKARREPGLDTILSETPPASKKCGGIDRRGAGG